MTETSQPTAEPGPPKKLFSEWWRTLESAPKRRLMFFLGLMGVLVICFARDLIRLVQIALASDIHSHVILIPVISGYLLWSRKEALPVPERGAPVLGSLLGVAGLAAFVAPWFLGQGGAVLSLTDRTSAAILAFILLAISSVAFCLGRRVLRFAAFPLGFLVFAVPMPDAMVDGLETASKLATAEVTDWFFSMTGLTYMRSATIFQMPSITLQVAQECSGIRSSFVLLITGVLAANILLKSTWRRLALVFLVIPLGVVRNAFRITVLAWLCENYGAHWIDSQLHHRGGPLFFGLSLLPLFIVIVLLRRSERNTEVPAAKP